MKKFFISFLATLAGIWFSLLLAIFGIFIVAAAAIAHSAGSSTVDIKDNSILRIDLSGSILDRQPKIDFMSIIKEEDKGITILSDITGSIEAASTDDRIKGIVINCSGSAAGLAQRSAIIESLHKFMPERAVVIRTMMDELMRISSHLLSFGCTAMDLGATTAFFYGFREREMVLDIFEKTCGARMSMNYNVIGGVVADIHPDFVKDVKALVDIMPERLKEYHTVFTNNLIARNRLEGVGLLRKEDAVSYDITGPSGRGSGWSCDCRKKHPYAAYDRVEFDEVLLDGCDSFSRYMVRMKEIEQSCRILAQLVDNIPEGDIRAQVPKILKLPEGRWYQQVEASRGTFGVYIESKGEKTPWRVHFQSPCFNLVGVMDLTCSGYMIADLITIGAALDFVIPDIDR